MGIFVGGLQRRGRRGRRGGRGRGGRGGRGGRRALAKGLGRVAGGSFSFESGGGGSGGGASFFELLWEGGEKKGRGKKRKKKKKEIFLTFALANSSFFSTSLSLLFSKKPKNLSPSNSKSISCVSSHFLIFFSNSASKLGSCLFSDRERKKEKERKKERAGERGEMGEGEEKKEDRLGLLLKLLLSFQDVMSISLTETGGVTARFLQLVKFDRGGMRKKKGGEKEREERTSSLASIREWNF